MRKILIIPPLIVLLFWCAIHYVAVYYRGTEPVQYCPYEIFANFGSVGVFYDPNMVGLVLDNDIVRNGYRSYESMSWFNSPNIKDTILGRTEFTVTSIVSKDVFSTDHEDVIRLVLPIWSIFLASSTPYIYIQTRNRREKSLKLSGGVKT